MALEAWEIVLIAVIILLLLKPQLVTKAARSVGKAVGEYKKGKSTNAKGQ